VEVVLVETSQVQQEQMVVLLVDLVVVDQLKDLHKLLVLEVLEQLKEEILVGQELLVVVVPVVVELVRQV
jgi:hypothetical protein